MPAGRRPPPDATTRATDGWNFLLHRPRGLAIVPAPLNPTEPTEPTDQAPRPLDVVPVLPWWLRGMMLSITAGIVVVLTIAVCLNPYQEDGTPRTMETHRQMGLPPCTFKSATGLPCPSCGMTTSFSLLMHGDPINSLRANAVGTLLAAFCILLVPWSLISVWLGRPLFILSVEAALMRVIVAFITLMLLRWVIVLAWIWWNRT
jgi:Protein of unknown function (DUF2752)